ncbi:Pectic enzymes secretion protein OutO [Thalassovita gelatinovora]|uniref:Prepilin leader peptidase/N-methyltransferase n=1 Tax=Thalassovita gelatinovora TaxID=53501 RepID=A0A0P1FMP5_THAGE|nr:A24 family peptidase [Thalassovita gelatinovora]QIZ80948.1 prepilin peptidase [Thalassovita gelatinovora]CUH63471.1 Pectic enzymes secretion protein OutO [Thalassovita gelatinovora]SEQ67459.1 leader peptidase (prepilin peptidase) / N-methyltransferase [Thalassovita gelatinovora]
MPDPRFSALLLILAGPFMGSFLALLADRLPRGEDVIVKPSHCRDCNARLRLRDLLPVLSFGLTRGRCRHCGAAIPPVTLYSEIIATGAAILAVLAGGGTIDIWLSAGFLWLLLVLTLCDLQWFRLPDLLTGMLFLITLGMAVRGGAMDQALIGAGLGAGAFLALRLGYHAIRGREGLGLGDVKLMAGLGAFAGPLDLPLLVLIAAFGALAVAGGGYLLDRTAQDTPLAVRKLPFGSALCAAAAILWLLRAGV